MDGYILSVTLNPAIDKTIKLKQLVLGEDHRCNQTFYSAGGKGINVSRALQKLGVCTLSTGFLGGPAGEYIKSQLHKEKIIGDFVEIAGETRTSFTMIDTSTGKLTRVLEEGPRISRRERMRFKEKFIDLIKSCRIVVLSGRNISGAGEAFYRELTKIAQGKNKKVVLDTSGKPLFLGLQAKPFLIKPNLQEMEFLLQQRVMTISQIKKAMTCLFKKGVGNIIISLGRKGAVGSDGENFWLASPPKKNTINTVGCGDALVAGFLYAYTRGKGFKSCLQFGVATGSANALNLQPGLLKKRELAKLLHKVEMRNF
ncbi:MAG: 1-phosphofructokinase family hexose kinase [Candidatus Omnitrophica bacterium]|nr:1-phosphofructokinase family hexose kinase [Candidatus Omnitrophota bacterium]